MTTPPRPAAVRRALRLATVGLFLLAAVLAGLIAAGAFDPRPLGPPAGSSRPGPLSLEGRGEMLARQSPPWNVAPARYTVRLTAAHAAGETDSAYGLALGQGATLTAAVSPLGEAAVWQNAPGAAPVYYVPWQPWPHARPGAATNELWLDVEANGDRAHLTVRINRELLWQGEVAAPGKDAALWLANYGDSVTIDFHTLAWFGATEEEITD